MIDLDNSETERLLADAARSYLDRRVTHELLTLIDGDTAAALDMWPEMVELGWAEIAVPIHHGGAGGDLRHLSVLLREIGRAALASPLFQTISAAVMLSTCGVKMAAADAALGEFAAGRARGSVVGSWQTRADLRSVGGGTQKLTGKAIAEWADVADLLVTLFRTREGLEGVALIDTAAPGVDFESVAAFDNERIVRVVFDDVEVADSAVIVVDPAALRQALHIMDLLRASDMVGNAARVLEMTIRHVTDRKQFGKPLGSFQAVQHGCADMAMWTDGATLAVDEALWRATMSLPFGREATVATYIAGMTVERVAVSAAQYHGGVGFVKEYPLHFYFRRAKAQRLRLGAVRAQLERAAVELVDHPLRPNMRFLTESLGEVGAK